MKKILRNSLFSLFLVNSLNAGAQNWVNGGNVLSANGILGTTTNFSLAFKTNNRENGRLTNSGLWGFGTSAPTSKVHINSVSGQVPFRVQVNGATKFFVNSNGGVSVGSSLTAPANGLFVAGNVGIGTSAPENRLHVFNGSAGIAPFPLAPLIIESPTHNYINILAPFGFETGILFGNPQSNINGGIIYNAAGNTNGFQFRDNLNITRMTITGFGNVGIGADPGKYKTRVMVGIHDNGGLDIANERLANDWELFPGTDLFLSFSSALRGIFRFNTGIYESISDERLKKNIRPMSTILDKINKLKPSTYQFKNSTTNEEYNGFIAQDVMKLFPAMVTHSVDTSRKVDVYTMDYSGFGVLAIKGIQELQPIIEAQKEKIKTLEARITKLEQALEMITSGKNKNVSNSISTTSLEQNKPNPFTANTTIRYSIPKSSRGQIIIYDMNGKILKSLEANDSGVAQVDGNSLPPGTYIYALIVNGKTTLSKKMVIIK